MTTKIAYLTIDDSPSKDFRMKVDFLAKKKIPAIFFCEGHFLEKREKDAIYAIKNGFVIGNHSYSHPHFSNLTLEQAEEEIKRTDDIIEKIYKKSGVKRLAKLFRFPYFDKGASKNSKEYEKDWLNYTNLIKKKQIQDYLKKLGYKQPKFENITLKWYKKAGFDKDIDVLMTFDQMEYELGKKDAEFGLNNESAILARIDEDFPEQGRSLNYPGTNDIILVHDHENTAKLFFKIISKYIEKGIKFKMPKLK